MPISGDYICMAGLEKEIRLLGMNRVFLLKKLGERERIERSEARAAPMKKLRRGIRNRAQKRMPHL